ncbi:hypothetical protein Micbo1qcDRAFT_199249 [Microdochium bolleyi]|uniref:DUF7918 domain-containing protein n=1 Tax=Microdochium bolleyi TaxID=196109 RepID=A0A136JGZ4_9PEZI|nr:hypothetical protein Micbo1qcDRAFT_199249 [Microdochium bolleyi]
MAVINCVPGLKVTVEVEGETATEYEDHENSEPSSAKTVVKYIESRAGATFSICVKTDDTYDWSPSSHALSPAITIDGVHQISLLFGPFNHLYESVTDGVSDQQPSTGDWLIRRFTFSSLQLVEKDPPKSSNKPTMSEIGSLKVAITRRLVGPEHEEGSPWAGRGQDLKVSEKTMKGRAISHGTSFTTGQKALAPIQRHSRRIESDDGPIATFCFLYRSRDDLKKEMIIPRSPSPRSPSPDDIDSMSVEELRRLVRLGKFPEVKTETRPKRERIGRDEAIDLTGEETPACSVKRARRQSPIDLTDD